VTEKSPYAYRAHFKYKNWIRKPDPSGFGDYYLCSDNLEYLKREAVTRASRGDKLLEFQKWTTEWVKIKIHRREDVGE
jgi:hypothetical protein